MEYNLSDVQINYQNRLSQAAFGYLKAGLGLFHKYQESDYVNPQAALGNLAIAVELMLKAFVASKHLTLLFKGLPLETRVLITCPESLPENVNWRAFDIDLRSAKHELIELDACKSIFYTFFPDQKQPLQPYLRFLSTFRNTSIHSILPHFHEYEVERTTYIALQIYNILQESGAFGRNRYIHSQADKRFLDTFQEDRSKRVRDKIKSAKELAKKLTDQHSSPQTVPQNDWEHLTTSCFICNNNNAVLDGFVELVADYDEQRTWAHLLFYPHRFECDACKLILNDLDELKLAGSQTTIEMSEDALAEYMRHIKWTDSDYYNRLDLDAYARDYDPDFYAGPDDPDAYAGPEPDNYDRPDSDDDDSIPF